MLLRLNRFRFISIVGCRAMSAPAPTTKSAAKKEAKRLEKEAKLAAKVANQPPSTPSSNGGKKLKVDKDKKDEDAPYVNTTQKGRKKGLSWNHIC